MVWPCRSTRRVNSCCEYPKTSAQARICADVSSALRPGTNWPRMSSRPRKAVIAPDGSLRAARDTGRPYRSGRALKTADGGGSCYGSCGEPDKFDHEEVRWFGGRLDYIVDVCHLYADLSWLTGRNERLRLVSRALPVHTLA